MTMNPGDSGSKKDPLGINHIQAPPTDKTPTYGEALADLSIRLIKDRLLDGKVSTDTLIIILTLLASLVDRENLNDIKMDRAFTAIKDSLNKHVTPRKT